jgi:general secretion pathway protein K
MNSRSARPCGAQGGVALVVALLVFALCASLLVALQRDFLITYQRVSNGLLAAQSNAYLRGAEELAALVLALDHDADAAAERPRDTLLDIWAQPAQPYPLDEGGWLVGDLQDLQGRFNLNSLGAPPRDSGEASYDAAQQAFIRLLQALPGEPLDRYTAIAITEAIADWIDADSEPRPGGAEASFYVSRTPSYRPADQPMARVSELRAVANVTPELYAKLRPLVTVWPREGGQINIHTAPVTVLRALNVDGSLEPLSEVDGEALLTQRRGLGFAGVEDFLAQPAFAGASTAQASQLIGETSSYFLLTARVTIADREARRYSVLRRQAREVTVLERVDASLYDLPPTPGEAVPDPGTRDADSGDNTVSLRDAAEPRPGSQS